MSRRRKIAWRCRRGLKELDVILEPFVAERLSLVDEEALPALERLLELDDQTLLATLIGQTPASDPGIAAMALLVAGLESPDGASDDRC